MSLAFPQSIAEIIFRWILVTPAERFYDRYESFRTFYSPSRGEHSMSVTITMGFYSRRRMKMANNTEAVTEFLILDRRYTVRIYVAVDEPVSCKCVGAAGISRGSCL